MRRLAVSRRGVSASARAGDIYRGAASGDDSQKPTSIVPRGGLSDGSPRRKRRGGDRRGRDERAAWRGRGGSAGFGAPAGGRVHRGGWPGAVRVGRGAG